MICFKFDSLAKVEVKAAQNECVDTLGLQDSYEVISSPKPGFILNLNTASLVSFLC